jgi:hypothetical protein
MYKKTFFSLSASYETLLFILYSLDAFSFKAGQSMCFGHLCTVLKYGWFGFLSTPKVQPCSLLNAPQNCWQVSRITVQMFWNFILV